MQHISQEKTVRIREGVSFDCVEGVYTVRDRTSSELVCITPYMNVALAALEAYDQLCTSDTRIIEDTAIFCN